jgi:hypothetical protein
MGILYAARTMATSFWHCLHGLLAAALACTFLLVTVPARAQQEDPREAQARSECLAGRYHAGVALLAQRSVETGSSDCIYNQGPCCEQNGKPDETSLRFREVPRKAKDLSAEERAEVNGHIAESQAVKPGRASGFTLATTGAPAPLPASPPGEVQIAPPAAPASVASDKPVAVAAPAGVAETAPAQPSANPMGMGMRMGGIMVGSVGVAGLITGVIFSLMTRSIANEVTADNARRTYSRSTDNRGSIFDNLQLMGYTLGGGLLATGGFLYYLGYRDAHSSASDSLSFLPVLLPGGSGAVMRGSF